MHKTRCGGLCICICFKPSNSLEYVTAKYWQNRKTSDKVITNIKRVTIFLRHSVYVLLAYSETRPYAKCLNISDKT